MHISTLPGQYSCGSFGKEATDFVDFLNRGGFSYWQVLPFYIVDEGNSPYKSLSAFAGNPYFIDLDILAQKGLVTKDELEEAKQNTPYECEFERLREQRLALLKKASERVSDRTQIRSFIKGEPHIAKFCEFMARRESNGEKPWYMWQNDRIDEETSELWQFVQYEFFTQWKAVKDYANSKGIKIIGDIPIYVDLDSADVWSNREQYMLDKKGRPTKVAGVPPDYFSEDGQLWGNPLYDWKEMKKDGYKWWCDRIRHMSKLFDGIRIDHFRGIESFWAVPAKAKTAKEGKWIKGPGLELVEKIKKAAGKAMIIAEDLGDITPEVEKLVKQSGFPGMRVFQFAFLGDKDSPHLPHNYVSNCISYTGTHDNNTLLGYLWELDDETRNRMLQYCGHNGEWQSGCESIIRTMFMSHSDTVIMPIQDLLGYGCDTRFNIPGKPSGNWRFRLRREQIDSIDTQKYLQLNKMYSRASQDIY